MATLAHSVEIDSGDRVRNRNWGTVIYQESVDPDYLRIIEESGVQAVVSPLHDRDKVNDNGEEFKKPHYHIILKFSGMKSRKQVKEFIASFGGVGAEDIKSMPGSVQYLWHMNSPDKAQYNKDDCVCLNGFDLERYMPEMDKNFGFCEVISYIEANDEIHFSSLMRSLIKERPDLVPVCRRDSYSIVNYLKSRESELKRQSMIDIGSGVPEAPKNTIYHDGFRKLPPGMDF